MTASREDGLLHPPGHGPLRPVHEGPAALPTVLVLAGDPIVGRTLELLVRTDDRVTRYVDGPVAEGPIGDLGAIDRVRVVLLAPRWSSASRRVAAELRDRAPDPASVAILEMGVPPDGVSLDPDRHVPWPCRPEELKGHIDAALAYGQGHYGGEKRGGTRSRPA